MITSLGWLWVALCCAFFIGVVVSSRRSTNYPTRVYLSVFPDGSMLIRTEDAEETYEVTWRVSAQKTERFLEKLIAAKRSKEP